MFLARKTSAKKWGRPKCFDSIPLNDVTAFQTVRSVQRVHDDDVDDNEERPLETGNNHQRRTIMRKQVFCVRFDLPKIEAGRSRLWR